MGSSSSSSAGAASSSAPAATAATAYHPFGAVNRPLRERFPSIPSVVARAVQQNPRGTSTIQANRTRTWAETGKRVARLAGALKHDLRLTRAGRVGIIALNSDRYLETFFAVALGGGIVVPINIRLAPAEMVEQLQDCEMEVVLVDDAFAGVVPALKQQVKSLRHVVYCGDAPQPPAGKGFDATYEDVVAKASKPASLDDADVPGGHDTFGIFYTGGTTGKSKGVELSHANIFVNALGHVATLGYTRDTVYMCAVAAVRGGGGGLTPRRRHSAPMFHLADNSSTFGVSMACAAHVFIPRFVPEDALDAIERWGVTNAMMVPAMVAMTLQSKAATASGRKLTSLRNIIYGAAPMPTALLQQAMSVFPNSTFTQGYGQSESSPALTRGCWTLACACSAERGLTPTRARVQSSPRSSTTPSTACCSRWGGRCRGSRSRSWTRRGARCRAARWARSCHAART